MKRAGFLARCLRTVCDWVSSALAPHHEEGVGQEIDVEGRRPLADPHAAYRTTAISPWRGGWEGIGGGGGGAGRVGRPRHKHTEWEVVESTRGLEWFPWPAS